MTSAPEPATADLFVIFGITGDLAKKMTFGSLYRLEQRGLLNCPIIGVAAEELSLDELVSRARTAIGDAGNTIDDKVFERFAARLSYLHGDVNDPELYRRLAEALSRCLKNVVVQLVVGLWRPNTVGSFTCQAAASAAVT